MTGLPEPNLVLLSPEAVRVGMDSGVHHMPPQVGFRGHPIATRTTQDLPCYSFEAIPETREVAGGETPRPRGREGRDP